MPRKYAKGGDGPPPRGGGGGKSRIRTLWRGFQTLVIVAFVLYAAGLVIGRTEGFRSLVAQRLEKILGMPVKIGGVSLDLKYGLKLRDVVTEGTRRPSSPGLRAQRVEIEWRWSDLWHRGRIGIARLELDRPVVVFEEQEEGGWAPAPLAPFAEFLLRQLQFSVPTRKRAADKTPLPVPETTEERPAREKNGLTTELTGLDMAIVFKRGEVVWWTGDAAVPAASIEGASLNATPLHLPDRELTHYLLKVDRAASANGPGMRDLVIELLDTSDQQVILRFLGEHLAAPRPKS